MVWDSSFTFLGYLYTFIRNYRMLEEPCRELKELVHHFPTPGHSTIQRGIMGLVLKVERVDMSGNMLIVDYTGLRLGSSTEYVD